MKLCTTTYGMIRTNILMPSTEENITYSGCLIRALSLPPCNCTVSLHIMMMKDS